MVLAVHGDPRKEVIALGQKMLDYIEEKYDII